MTDGLTNEGLFERAVRVIPGGVNSPVRAFRSVGGTPYFVARAEGAYVWDVEGRRYTDYVQSYGASILGHADPVVVAAIREAALAGTTYGAPTEGEVRLAEDHGGAGARTGDGPPDEQRDGGGHVGRAPGPRRHRSGQGRQVRRLLPRPQRLAPRRRRQRHRQPGPERLGGRDRRGRGRHRGGALQRGAAGRRADGRRLRRAGGGQHGSRPARPRLPPGPARRLRPGRRPAAFRRGHHRLPPGPGRGGRALRGDARPLVLRQGDRRRPARGCLRGHAGRHGAPGSHRARVPGGHPLGEPARHRRRPRRPGAVGRGCPRHARGPGRRPADGAPGRDRRSRPARPGAAGRAPRRPALRRVAGDRLRRGGGVGRQRPVRPVLPRPARPRRRPRPRPVRGPVPISGPQLGRHRADRRPGLGGRRRGGRMGLGRPVSVSGGRRGGRPPGDRLRAPRSRWRRRSPPPWTTSSPATAPARMWAADHTLWSDDPEEVADRLGWLVVPGEMDQALPEIEGIALAAAADGLERVVLMGMGGSSLFPEVLRRSFPRARAGWTCGCSTPPTRPPSAVPPTAWAPTAASSSPPPSPATRSRWRASSLILGGDRQGGGATSWPSPTPGRRWPGRGGSGPSGTCSRTGPTSAAATRRSRTSGWCRGPCTGSTASGCCNGRRWRLRRRRPSVPAAEHPAVRLGAALGASAMAGRDKLTLVLPDEIAAFGLWLEQLVAESTGKEGTGIVPVAGEPLGPPEVYGDDRLFVAIGPHPGLDDLVAAGHPVVELAYGDPLDLGAPGAAVGGGGGALGGGARDQPLRPARRGRGQGGDQPGPGRGPPRHRAGAASSRSSPRSGRATTWPCRPSSTPATRRSWPGWRRRGSGCATGCGWRRPSASGPGSSTPPASCTRGARPPACSSRWSGTTQSTSPSPGGPSASPP